MVQFETETTKKYLAVDGEMGHFFTLSWKNCLKCLQLVLSFC